MCVIAQVMKFIYLAVIMQNKSQFISWPIVLRFNVSVLSNKSQCIKESSK